MMRLKVVVLPSASEHLDALPESAQRKVAHALRVLAHVPRSGHALPFADETLDEGRDSPAQTSLDTPNRLSHSRRRSGGSGHRGWLDATRLDLMRRPLDLVTPRRACRSLGRTWRRLRAWCRSPSRTWSPGRRPERPACRTTRRTWRRARCAPCSAGSPRASGL